MMKPRMPLMLATLPIALALTVASGEAWADVKAGVDAWSQGDYARALSIWRPLADGGDADAQFNIAQAYKFGHGVPQDMNAAIDYYRRAAAQGHAQAEDNAGLLLYQQGRRTEAMPYLNRSAERGEARAQYLVGISLFNGDLLPRDWVRAYAMMNRASASGVAQATQALEHMDRFIPEAQRRDGLALAAAMTARAQQPDQKALDTPPPPATAPWRPAPSSTPVRTADLPPSQPAPAAKPAPTTASTAPQAVQTARPAPRASGAWQIQLGAFSEKARAETQWKILSAKIPALATYTHSTEAAGALTRLLAGPFTTRADADALCDRVKAGGGACIVKSS